MSALADRLQHRLLPAVLAALGVSLVAAGLLSYSSPVEATPNPSDLPAGVIDTPRPSAKLTFPPFASPSAAPSATSSPAKPVVATRVVIPASASTCRSCRPGGPTRLPAVQRRDVPRRASASPATARDLPLRPRPRGHVPAAPRCLARATTASGMLGDARPGLHERRPLYLTRSPRSGATSRRPDDALRREDQELWLQTSEGPNGTSGSSRSSPSRSASGRPTRGRPPEGPPDRLRLARRRGRARRRPGLRSSRSGAGTTAATAASTTTPR